MGKKGLSAKEVLADIRSGMADDELMRKYQLSTTGLQKLFQKLIEAKVMKQSELDARTLLFEDMAKVESATVDKRPGDVEQKGKQTGELRDQSTRPPRDQPGKQFSREEHGADTPTSSAEKSNNGQRQESQGKDLKSQNARILTILLMIVTCGIYPVWRSSMRTRTKTILTGVIVIAVISFLGGRGVSKKDGGPPAESPRSESSVSSVQMLAEKADLKEGEKYSKNYLSEMIRVSATYGLDKIGVERDSIEADLVKQTFGQKMPPLREVIDTIIAQEFNCDPQTGDFASALTRCVDLKYQLKGFEHDAHSKRVLELKLKNEEQRLKGALAKLPSGCGQAAQEMDSVLDDVIPPAVKERERIIASIAEKTRKEREQRDAAMKQARKVPCRAFKRYVEAAETSWKAGPQQSSELNEALREASRECTKPEFYDQLGHLIPRVNISAGKCFTRGMRDDTRQSACAEFNEIKTYLKDICP